MMAFEKVLLYEKPNWVVVVGDVERHPGLLGDGQEGMGALLPH